MKKSFYKGLSFLALVFITASSVFAQRESDYDPYSTILKYPSAQELVQVERRERVIFFARLLEQPFRPVGFVLGETAEWVEQTHLEDKLTWFFTELHSHGIYPELKIPTTGGLFAMGPHVRIQLEKLLKIEQSYATANIFGGWTPNKDYAGSTVDFGGDYKIEAPTAPLYHKGLAKYQRSSAESFYGIGQEGSRGEYSSYQPEEVWFEGALGYLLNDAHDLSSSFVYQHMNIGNGNRERIGKIKEHFPTGIPGINGGNLVGLVNKWTHDNRDHKTDPRRGGYQDVEFSYFHDTDGSNLHYLKMAGSVSHFIPIVSDRRVLALRLAAEKNQELGGDEIPFYNLARLGGSNRQNRSELLRSYAYNRFFEEGVIIANAEYRYNIYEYGNFAGDAVALFDVGEVFEEIQDFGFDELKFSYGAGLNIKYRRRTILSFALARGSEGWAASTHTRASF